MHSDGIWKRFGTEEKKWQKDAKWCILTVFETILNCRDHFETRTLSRALWHILKRYLKQLWKKWAHVLILSREAWSRPCACNPGLFLNKDGDWCILTLFENSQKRKENKDNKWCLLLLFDTIFWSAGKLLKAVRLNGAFWHFLRPLFNDF